MLTIPDINELIDGPERRAVPIQLDQVAVAPAEAEDAAAARAADGRGQEAARLSSGQPARLHDDRVHAPRRRRRSIGATYGEFGWILEDNKGMLSIAQLPGAAINHRYRIYEKTLRIP